MAQDLRKLMKQESGIPLEHLPKGHEKRFQKRLEQALPEERRTSPFLWLKVAAVLIIALTTGGFFFFQADSFSDDPGVVFIPEEDGAEDFVPATSKPQPSLREISPEFKKIEEYYLANLHLGISRINITDDNKALIDAFMAQLSELDKEYGRLNKEFSDQGPHAETLSAMVQNLQLRLDLLMKLKIKMDELNTQHHENYRNNQA